MSKNDILLSLNAAIIANNSQEIVSICSKDFTMINSFPGERRISPIMLASANKNVTPKTLELMLKCGVQAHPSWLNATSYRIVSSPLIEAVKSYSLDKIKLLISYHAPVNYCSKNLTTALFSAVGLENDPFLQAKIVKLLLEHGAKDSLFMTNEQGQTPFLAACLRNKVEVIKVFCTLPKEELAGIVNQLLSDGSHPLCNISDVETIKLLVEKGATPDQMSKLKMVINATTLADSSLLKYCLSICKPDLLNYKINDTSITALESAVLSNRLENVELLLKQGVIISADIISIAVNVGNYKICHTLLKSGGRIYVNTVNECGFSVLHQAVFMGNWKLVSLLVDEGADVNYQHQETNKTALHIAIFRMNKYDDLTTLQSVKALIACGANINLPDSLDSTVCDYVSRLKVHYILDLLKIVQEADKSFAANEACYEIPENNMIELQNILHSRYRHINPYKTFVVKKYELAEPYNDVEDNNDLDFSGDLETMEDF